MSRDSVRGFERLSATKVERVVLNALGKVCGFARLIVCAFSDLLKASSSGEADPP
jgi:hypothetical protein